MLIQFLKHHHEGGRTLSWGPNGFPAQLLATPQVSVPPSF